MLKSDVIAYFGRPSLAAKALGVTKSTVSNWKIRVPPLQAARLERLTHGKLRFDPDAYPRGSAAA